MRWRYLKLDFPYLLGELVIVILGVTIALAAEQWRQASNDRTTSSQYISRLIEDIQSDQLRWDDFTRSLQTKSEALEDALNWTYAPDYSQESVKEFLQNLTDGAQRSYAAGMRGRRITFDELISSGNLNLIDSVGLRQSLFFYYGSIESESFRLTNRSTDYAATMYRLIPRDPEFVLAPNLTMEDLEKIMERAMQLDLESLIIAESNFGRLERESVQRLDQASQELLNDLQRAI